MPDSEESEDSEPARLVAAAYRSMSETSNSPDISFGNNASRNAASLTFSIRLVAI